MKGQRKSIVCVWLMVFWLCSIANAQLSPTAFTWSGGLSYTGGFLKGEYDLLFRLFDQPTGGNQLGLDCIRDNVDASDGFVRYVALDFGIDVFDGETRWLEISYRAPGEEVPHQTLDAPRKAVSRLYVPMTGGDVDFLSSLRVGSEGFARYAFDVSTPWAFIGLNGTGQNKMDSRAGITLENNGVPKWHIFNNAHDYDNLTIESGDPEADNIVKIGTTLSGRDAVFNGVVIGGDPTGVGYAATYTSIGVSSPGLNLRLQSPNGIYFHVDVDADETYGTALAIDPNGNVGIGTNRPAYKLDVEGAVQAREYYTGDIIFQKDGTKPVWRMYEDEAGLYVESLTTGQHYSVVLKEIGAEDGRTPELEALEAENERLKQRLDKLEARMATLTRQRR
jgi:hypothetical protein